VERICGKVMETVYGKHHKYEVIKNAGLLSTNFVIHRDRSYWKGSYDSLARAVKVAKDAG
jgi:hypothetical protein